MVGQKLQSIGIKKGMAGIGILSNGSSPAFRFEVKTTGADTFQLPLESGGTYDFNIDWGDGSESDITVWNHADTNHSYAEAGTYNVIITGTITGWKFNNHADAAMVYETSSWGNLALLPDASTMFYGCSNMTVKSGAGSFDTSNVTSMSQMFRGCSSLTSIDVSDWNVSSTTSMSQMFRDCSSLTGLDVSGWDVSSVTTMFYVFDSCSSLTTIDVSSWDTAKVTNMGNIFKGCSQLATLDVSGWNTSLVTITYYMFDGCSSLTAIDVSEWNVSSAVLMYKMFSGCTSLTTIDVSSWDVSSATSMSSMFYNCSSLTTIDVSDWDVSSVTSMTSMFDGVTLPTSDYDALILNFSADVPSGVYNFHGGNSKYTGGGAVETAMDAWEAKGWTITDSGTV